MTYYLLDFGGGERPFFDLKKVCCLTLVETVDRLDCPDHFFCREGRRAVGLAARVRRLPIPGLHPPYRRRRMEGIQKWMEETLGGLLVTWVSVGNMDRELICVRLDRLSVRSLWFELYPRWVCFRSEG